ncbi:RHS repeat-associated core domain-containing protein [Sorangium cellulosum]|uniref:RHS repeat-associated core domain-containing protein n=1 Tax=Sorangium cellulosum TaxID=56 RepID=UPI0012DB7909|nr:RHS repeat-associated core domain-containing protein [Sorangium cellulosum]
MPNIPAIPGMNPGVFVMGGGGAGGGSGGRGGKGSKNAQGADRKNGGKDAEGGGKSACGTPGKDGGGCPRHHGGSRSGAASHGDPIDVVTGRVFTTPVVDLELPGPMPLELARSYATSSRDRDVGLGHGWTHTFAWEVQLRRSGAVVWTEDGLDGGEPLAHREILHQGGKRSEGAWVYYVNDLAGFPERLVDGGGRVLGELGRTVWGATAMQEGGTAATPIRFLGQYADAETGLFYNRYRYYDPQMGRYISPDPLELLGGLNVFAYARNSPFFFGDPHGLVYTRIVDNSTDPATVLAEGYNIDEARGKPPERGGQIPQTFTNKPCAETQALQRMKNDITGQIQDEQRVAKARGNKKQPFKPMTPNEVDAEANRRLRARFDDPNVSIETFQEKGGPRVDPCDSCGQMIADLQIGHAVVGAKGKRGQYGTYRKPRGY